MVQCEAQRPRMGSNECMEVLDKWWQSSSSLTLTDFRKLIHNYSVFRDTDLLVRMLNALKVALWCGIGIEKHLVIGRWLASTWFACAWH